VKSIWVRFWEALYDEFDVRSRRTEAMLRKLDHVTRQNQLLLRLVRQLLEQTPDPAQVAALGEEIAQLEAAAGKLTGAIDANNPP
jgi:hypothetical protein